MRRFGSISVMTLSLALAAAAVPTAGHAQIICVSNNVPPPELPVYDQPPIPAAGYIWTPGYWAGGPTGYFWVPGTWVLPPTVGLLWTPGYWGWRDGIYVWTAGYWGPHIGFYGGINYGFGYTGFGYEGGHWDNGVFAYNRTVNNFGGVTITNVYEKTVVVDVNARVSFNGGSGGTMARPTPEQEAAAHEQHIAAIPAQLQHERVASSDRSLLASENHGRPAIAATATPGDFTKGAVAAREAEPVTPRPPTQPGAAVVTPAPTEHEHHEEHPPGTAVVSPPPTEHELHEQHPPGATVATPPPPAHEHHEEHGSVNPTPPPPPHVATTPPAHEEHGTVKPPPPPAPPPPHVATTPPHPAPQPQNKKPNPQDKKNQPPG
jgi:hypothetical protein